MQGTRLKRSTTSNGVPVSGYAMDKSLNGRTLVLDLLHKRDVAVAPGSGFGSITGEYVRISLGASEEEIERGMRDIYEFSKRGTDSIV
jgi:aspartate/methionine/tyrosine aminotransferase